MSKLKKFKSHFKRFVLVLPVISFILFSVIPISSFASFNLGNYTVGEEVICPYSSEFKTKKFNIDQALSVYNSDYYFHIQFYSSSLNDKNRYSLFSLYVPVSHSYSLNSSGSSIDVVFSSPELLYFAWQEEICTDSGYMNVSSYRGFCDDYSLSIYSFSYDLATNIATFYTSQDKSTYKSTYSSTFLSCTTNIFDTSYDPNQLNVDVTFSPPLRGDVSREFEYNGILQKYTSFNMTITNNSAKPIIYFMYIDSYDSSNPIVDNDCNWHNEFGHWSYPSSGVSFQFIKKEWVYSRNMDTQSSFSGTTADRWKKYYKPTFYHYLAAGDSLTQTFNWSQINILANTNYYCLVGAQLTELDCGSDISNYDSDALNSEYKDFPITGFSPVYHSIFSLSDLSDIPYNPNDSSNGLIPNSDYRIEDSRYTMQFDASESMDGFLDYNSGDLYSDQNSWFNNKDVSSRPTVSGSGSFSFFSLIGGISNVYDFLRYSLSILPSEVYMIILSSIFIVIFIGIIKRLG